MSFHFNSRPCKKRSWNKTKQSFESRNCGRDNIDDDDNDDDDDDNNNDDDADNINGIDDDDNNDNAGIDDNDSNEDESGDASNDFQTNERIKTNIFFNTTRRKYFFDVI